MEPPRKCFVHAEAFHGRMPNTIIVMDMSYETFKNTWNISCKSSSVSNDLQQYVTRPTTERITSAELEGIFYR